MAKKKSYNKQSTSVLTYILYAIFAVIVFVGVTYVSWVLVTPAIDHTNWVDSMKTSDGWLVPFNYFKDLF